MNGIWFQQLAWIGSKKMVFLMHVRNLRTRVPSLMMNQMAFLILMMLRYGAYYISYIYIYKTLLIMFVSWVVHLPHKRLSKGSWVGINIYLLCTCSCFHVSLWGSFELTLGLCKISTVDKHRKRTKFIVDWYCMSANDCGL